MEEISDKRVADRLKKLKIFDVDYRSYLQGDTDFQSLNFPEELESEYGDLHHLYETYSDQENYSHNLEELIIISEEIKKVSNEISDKLVLAKEKLLESYLVQNQSYHLKRRLRTEKFLKIFLFLLPLLGIGIFIMIRSVRKPLDEMADAMREVRKENFSYSLAIDEDRSDELTQLKRDFNIMIRKLDILHRRMDEAREQLEHDAKQLKESVVSKTRFIRHLGHELRSPLAAISSFSELMLEGMHGDITVKQEESLQRIMKNASNLLELVNDLVDQAKAEAGILEMKLEDTELKAFCEDGLDAVKIEAEKAGLKVNFESGKDQLICALHPSRMRQVLTNLISNAIKFSSRGGELNLRVLKRGELAVFEVEDRGEGISPADQRNIFREFHQGDSYKKDAGAGLGLHLSRQIARLHGGDITVESEKGVGSTFRVQLPLVNKV